MKTLIKLAAAALVALGGAYSAEAQITRQGAGYLMRMKFAPGQTAKYSMSMNTSANGQQMNMLMPMVQKVLRVKNGVADLDYAVGPISMNGKQMSPQVQKVQISMDASGKVVKGAPMGQTGASVSLPAKPVRIGESWSVTTKTQAGMAGTMDVKATYTLAGFQNVGGKQAAKLNVKMSATGTMGMNGTGTMLLLSSDGSLHSADIKMKMTMQQGPQGKPMNIGTTMKIKRA